ncbi:MAG: GDP-mannose 4,6-dehydratase [Chloroflexi bacterium]|nr:GDP-mannose 4,6-dehydratase [Chloroflexota bacterium]
MRALVTGVGGFVGRHLAQHLQDQGDEVAGVGRSKNLATPSTVRMLQTDLNDRQAVERLVRETQPEAVYHLAAQSSPAESVANPWGTICNNLLSQLNVLEALLSNGLRPRVLVVGSSDEYGQVRAEDVPTSENAPLRPITPYAVSKVGQDMMGFQYVAQHGMAIVRVRPFNHTGPGHDARFVIPSFARQLAEIEAGLRDPVLRVGNLDVARDFTDARDMVRAYRLALIEGEPGEVYNIGSGRAVRLSEMLEELIALSGVRVDVRVDPARLRPSDIPHQEADTRKFSALTGWQPRIPWHTTLRDTFEYWRAKVREEKLCAS